ncbi:MAG TPA: 23S rRNA (adenine(2030)-N(6))-methyltransferase RlmJ [Caulobacteraceae bacterium]|nr:23S rRNA (adenine(2030)-N(6))-methyltransferase RlmJ [Caulobacteraceae bacterium]
MNYRHAFHAGNFADLLKHAVLTALVGALRARPGPLAIVDTHAGAGVYDLRGEAAAKTGEGEAGVGRLMRDAAAPGAFDALKAAVAALNPNGKTRFYPGSPILLTAAQRPGDSYLGCEIRADDNAALRIALKQRRGAAVTSADGWRTAVEQAARGRGRLLVLIDPPFERPDDYAQIVATVAEVRAQRRDAVIAVWLPIKDLATYDSFLGDLEDAAAPAPTTIAEVRLRPLSDPMKMNGCAMALVGAPAGVAAAADEAGQWIARTLGEPGAVAQVTVLGD